MKVVGVVPGQGWMAMLDESVEPIVAWLLIETDDGIEARAVTPKGLIDPAKGIHLVPPR